MTDGARAPEVSQSSLFFAFPFGGTGKVSGVMSEAFGTYRKVE